MMLILLGACAGCFIGILIATAIWHGTVEAYRFDCETHDGAAIGLAEKNAELRARIAILEHQITRYGFDDKDPSDWWKS